jgi:8-oxo-dGTP pyrophosphatase MutT (NUDIX family)
MKRLGVAGIITSGSHSLHILMGRRGKDPNRGLYVLPGGGVQDHETLEQAFCREVMEETGLEIETMSDRWTHLIHTIELPDRIILVAHASVKCRYRPEGKETSAGFFDDEPRDGSDLYDVAWFGINELPAAVSPVVAPVLAKWGYRLRKE